MQVIPKQPDYWFDLLFPLAGIAVWFGLTYSVQRTVFAGRPLTGFIKSLDLYGAIFLIGLLYAMSLVDIFKWPPSALWISVPVWALLVVIFIIWRERHKKGSPH